MSENTNWAEFDDSQWHMLIKERNLNNCLRIDTDVTKEKWSGLHSFEFPVPSGFDASSPNASAEVYALSTYDKTVNSYHESGYDVTSANVGVPGIASGSVETKHSHSHEETFEATDVYVTTQYRVPKVRLILKQDKIRLSDEFIHAIEEALEVGESEGRGTGAKGMAELQDMYITRVLDKYGHYVVTDLTLGGLLRATATKSVTSHSESSEFSQSVKASFSADLSAFDVPVSGGASAEEGSSHGSSESDTHEKVSLTITSIGGDPGAIKKYPEWAKSLAPASEWHIIRTGGLVPVINFLPKELLMRAAHAISAAEGYMDYTRKAVDDGSSLLDD